MWPGVFKSTGVIKIVFVQINKQLPAVTVKLTVSPFPLCLLVIVCSRCSFTFSVQVRNSFNLLTLSEK